MKSAAIPALFLTAFGPLMAVVAAVAAPRIEVFAGNGRSGSGGDGGPALRAELHDPFGIIRGPDGMLYVCEYKGHVVRRIDAQGIITTVAGNGTPGCSGDGGPALNAQLDKPHEIRFGPDGKLYIADMASHAIRCVDFRDGRISTVAGNGTRGFSGDGGQAVKAQLNDPISIQFGPDGKLYICDIGNHRVRTLDLNTGLIATVCGTGKKTATPDNAPFSPATPLNGPRTLDFDAAGNLWLALREGNAVFRADFKEGRLHHIAGTGKQGFSGNGGPARQAELAGPKGLAVMPDGRILIADTESHSIRVIDPSEGTINVLVGDGKKGSGQDGDPLNCRLARPHGIYAEADGTTIWIGDSENHVVRRFTLK